MNDADRQNPETRVLLLAATVKDEELTCALLARAGIACVACADQGHVCEQLTAGAGAVLIAEEAIHAGGGGLAEWLGRQAPWSDLPVLILARAGANSVAVARAMQELGNVTVLERPTRVAALVSVVRTALRARQRQYQLRDQLVQRERLAEQLNMAMAAAHAGSWHIDLSTGEFSASDRVIELHGLAPGTQLNHERALACVHPDDRASIQAALQLTIESGQPFRHEHRVPQPDGSVRWVSAHAERRGEGVHTCVIGHVQDITARKQTEEALRYSEQVHRVAFEQSPTGMVYVGLDGRLIKANPAMCEITGYSVEELLGMKRSELTHPDDLAHDAELLAPFLRADTPTYENDKRCVRKDGGARWVSVIARMVTDAEGRPLHSVDVVRDITVYKAAERMLRESQDKFSALANAAPAMLWVTKADATLEFISRGWHDYTGQTEAEAFGGDGFGWLKAIHPDDRERSGKIFRQANQKHESFSLDYRVRRADGKYRWAIDAGRPRIDAEGRFVGYVGSVIDVHDRKLDDERLRKSEARLRRVFESNVTGMIRWDLDRSLILDANAEFLRMTGYAHEDLTNGVLNFRVLTPPEWTDRNEAGIQTLRTEGFAAPYEKEYFRKDGSRVPVIIAGTRFEDSPSEGMSFLIDITGRKLTEEALRASEHRLRLTLEAAAIGLWDWDVATNAVTWSAECYIVHGMKEGEFDGTAAAFDRLLHPDDRNRVWAAVRAAVDGRMKYECEFRIVCPDGEVRWVANTGQAVYGPGSAGKMVGTVTDITDRKQAEAELRDGQQRMRLATDATSVGIWQWNFATGEIQWDAQMFRIYGIPPTADGCVRYDTWSSAVLPEDLPGQEEVLQETMRRHGRSNREFRIRRASDGECRVVEAVETVRTDADGQVEWVLGTNLDITDRKRAEEALRDSEARLGGILRQSPAGIVQTDAAGCMTLVNPRWCEMLGHPEAELLGRNIIEITHPSFVAATVKAFGQLVAGGPDFQIDKFYTRKDGSILRAQSNVAAIRSPAGEFFGLIAVVLDISERLRSEEELRRLAAELSEADRRKDVFLATLAHELRNPLAPIRNGLQVMKLSRNDGETVAQVGAMMDRQLSQLVRLVDDLLDVSRITQAKVELRKERVELKAVIEAAVETSRPAFEQAGHELAVVVPDEPIFVDGDATRLVQVISNLLHNAAKYTHRGGHVRLTAGRADGMAVVSVRDNGIGIPPTMIGRVFEMFTQVDRTLEKTTGGLGIGLSLVKGLLELHGGTIEAKSDGEGMGSEFVVRLPVAMAVVTGPHRLNGQTSEIGSSTLRRILVVDDNVDAADSLGQLLQMLGNEVRTANDGEAGIEVAAQFRPDLVLMDIEMPKLNGYEAAGRIRQHPWGRGMVLVALTGWGQENDRKRSADAGFDHHLVKPVEMDALMKLMSSLKCADALDVSASAAALPSVASS